MIKKNKKYSTLLSWIYILALLTFVALMASCSPQRRIQRLAEKHGVENTLTVKWDTAFKINSINFDTLIEKEFDIDSASLNDLDPTSVIYVDSNKIILNNGTEILIVDTVIVRENGEQPSTVDRKTGIVVFNQGSEININKNIDVDQIVVEPPDKLDVLLDNILWVFLSIIGLVIVVLVLRR